MFLAAAGFWNFLGAGVFGFLLNLPIVSYYEIGTALTANHAHASMMGVYGMLSIGLARVHRCRQQAHACRSHSELGDEVGVGRLKDGGGNKREEEGEISYGQSDCSKNAWTESAP